MFKNIRCKKKNLFKINMILYKLKKVKKKDYYSKYFCLKKFIGN